ncbi:MAG: hypothetical protein H0W06_08230 [Chloroflexia bacterium]|nr:hypothetical protein [Chloroflexia bacterium]
MTLAPGAGREMLVPGPELYAVESGTLGIRVDGPAFLTRAPTNDEAARREEMEPGVDYVLRPGDQALVLVRVGHHLVNDGLDPVKFLNVVIFTSSSVVPSWLPDAELPSGFAETPLATEIVGELGVLPVGAAEIVVQRATVAPDKNVPQAMTEGFALIVVEEGELSVSTSDEAPTTHLRGEVVRATPENPVKAWNAAEGSLKITSLIISPAETKRNR